MYKLTLYFVQEFFFVFFAVKAHLADENDIHQLSVLLLYIFNNFNISRTIVDLSVRSDVAVSS